MSKTTFKQDLKYGLKSETDVLQQIKKRVKCEVKKTGKYDIFDYGCEESKVFAELKTRRVNCMTYNTTIVGMDKVLQAKKLKKTGNKVYFFFKFNDGLYVKKYNKEMLGWGEDFVRNKRTDFNDKKKQYCHIPVHTLKFVKHI